MVRHITYDEDRYESPLAFVAGIREHVERGWTVSQVRGPSRGPWVAIYRKDDCDAAEHPAR